MINQRITKLRQLMKERGIDLYIIPTSDFHQSEYGQTVVILFKQKKNLPVVVFN